VEEIACNLSKKCPFIGGRGGLSKGREASTSLPPRRTESRLTFTFIQIVLVL